MRAEDWSYQDSLCPIQEVVRRSSRAELEVDKGIRQVEFILSSVLRERSCNLRGEEGGGGGGGLLSDIETQIRQLELGHATLGRVIARISRDRDRLRGESHCSVRPADNLTGWESEIRLIMQRKVSKNLYQTSGDSKAQGTGYWLSCPTRKMLRLSFDNSSLPVQLQQYPSNRKFFLKALNN